MPESNNFHDTWYVIWYCDTVQTFIIKLEAQYDVYINFYGAQFDGKKDNNSALLLQATVWLKKKGNFEDLFLHTHIHANNSRGGSYIAFGIAFVSGKKKTLSFWIIESLR